MLVQCMAKFTKLQMVSLLAGIYFFLAGIVLSVQKISYGLDATLTPLANVFFMGTGIALLLYALFGNA